MADRMDHVSASDARASLSDLLHRVAYGGDGIALTVRGKVRAVLISPDDLEALELAEDRVALAELAEGKRDGRAGTPASDFFAELEADAEASTEAGA